MDDDGSAGLLLYWLVIGRVMMLLLLVLCMLVMVLHVHATTLLLRAIRHVRIVYLRKFKQDVRNMWCTMLLPIIDRMAVVCTE